MADGQQSEKPQEHPSLTATVSKTLTAVKVTVNSPSYLVWSATGGKESTSIPHIVSSSF